MLGRMPVERELQQLATGDFAAVKAYLLSIAEHDADTVKEGFLRHGFTGNFATPTDEQGNPRNKISLHSLLQTAIANIEAKHRSAVEYETTQMEALVWYMLEHNISIDSATINTVADILGDETVRYPLCVLLLNSFF
jgi:hypothetical protein